MSSQGAAPGKFWQAGHYLYPYILYLPLQCQIISVDDNDDVIHAHLQCHGWYGRTITFVGFFANPRFSF